MSDEFLIPPPNSLTVEHEHRVQLGTHDGKPLVRQAGFRPMAVQAGGSFPQLGQSGKKKGSKKKGC